MGVIHVQTTTTQQPTGESVALCAGGHPDPTGTAGLVIGHVCLVSVPCIDMMRRPLTAKLGAT